MVDNCLGFAYNRTMMKTKRLSTGTYSVTVHGYTFNLECLGTKCWILFNLSGTEITRGETKSGLLKVMESWSPERVAEYATKEFTEIA